MGQAGAGGWLVECRDQDLVFEDVGVAAIASDWLQFFGDFEHTEELIAFEFFEREDVSPGKTSHDGSFSLKIICTLVIGRPGTP